MAQVIYAFRRSAGYGKAVSTHHHWLRRYLADFGRSLAAWRADIKRARAEAQLRHALDGYSEHLLRDMGLTWSSERHEPWSPDRHSWR